VSARAQVYILTEEGEELTHKIGVATYPPGRLRQVQANNSRPLRLSYVSAPMDRCAAFRVESRAHKDIFYHRLNGEWFYCPLAVAVSAVEDAISS
jgi:hypothetical protein